MYSIDKIVKVNHDDGRMEIVPCDATIELIALNLKEMGLSIPLVEERDGETLWDYLTGIDIEIGQVEDDLIATRKYNEQVGRAVDEFNLDTDEYIDYGKLNERLAKILERIEAGSFEPYVKIKWRKRRD
ncbi:MAG: hypothetical protein II855_03755 [Candidatus Methanomethylophilaceae archaeon]|nr:hypothetical protein [Candidatus Methanomethylophilaceae archaeon]